jgi:hypothetical protein
MLGLKSPRWASLSHAYGDGSDVPRLIAKLRASSPDEWDDVNNELMSAILHQGDVYTATYAAAPHLLEYAAELGPCQQLDDLLFSIASAARGGVGPDVPAFLADAWEDAQDEARDLILDRLLSRAVSESFAGSLIAGLLDLSGESEWAERVRNWVWGYAIEPRCPTCGNEKSVFWSDGRTRRALPDHSIQDFDVLPSSEAGITPDEELEFEDDQMPGQLIGLAASTGYSAVEKQMRQLFGRFACESCGGTVKLTPGTGNGDI